MLSMTATQPAADGGVRADVGCELDYLSWESFIKLCERFFVCGIGRSVADDDHLDGPAQVVIGVDYLTQTLQRPCNDSFFVEGRENDGKSRRTHFGAAFYTLSFSTPWGVGQ